MKIARGEITITDVPTVDYIKVDTASNSVAIKFDFFGSPVSYDFDHLVELRDALTTARGLLVDANNAAVAETVGKSTLRVAIPTLPPAAEVGDVFERGAEEPANILKVRDCEGDSWHDADGGYTLRGHSDLAWKWVDLLKAYGPLTVTEVDES